MKRGIFKFAVFPLIILGFSFAFAGEGLSQIAKKYYTDPPFGRERFQEMAIVDGKYVEVTRIITRDALGRTVIDETKIPKSYGWIRQKTFEYDYAGNMIHLKDIKRQETRDTIVDEYYYHFIEGKPLRIEKTITDNKVEVNKTLIDLDAKGNKTRIVETITDKKGEVTKTDHAWDTKSKIIVDNFKKTDIYGEILKERNWTRHPDGSTSSMVFNANDKAKPINRLNEIVDPQGKIVSSLSKRYFYDGRGRLTYYAEENREGPSARTSYVETRTYSGLGTAGYKSTAKIKGPNDKDFKPTTPRRVLEVSEVKTAAPGAKATVDPKVGALPGKPGGAAATPQAGAKPAAAATPAAPKVAATPPKAATPTAVKPPALPGGAVSTPQAAVSPAAAPKVVATPPRVAPPPPVKPPGLPGGAVSTPRAAVSPPAAPKVVATPPRAAPPMPVKPPVMPGGAQPVPQRLTSPQPVAPKKAPPTLSPPPKRPGEMR